MLILFFAVRLGWLPTSGYGGVQFVILPALALAFRPLGRISQVVRSAMLDQFSQPYVTTARAKGLTERVVVYLHTLKNAAIPVATLVGDEAASLLNGAVVIETVFGWPGVGILLIQAIERRDLPLIEASRHRHRGHDRDRQPAWSTSPTPSSTRGCATDERSGRGDPGQRRRHCLSAK